MDDFEADPDIFIEDLTKTDCLPSKNVGSMTADTEYKSSSGLTKKTTLESEKSQSYKYKYTEEKKGNNFGINGENWKEDTNDNLLPKVTKYRPVSFPKPAPKPDPKPTPDPEPDPKF